MIFKRTLKLVLMFCYVKALATMASHVDALMTSFPGLRLEVVSILWWQKNQITIVTISNSIHDIRNPRMGIPWKQSTRKYYKTILRF